MMFCTPVTSVAPLPVASMLAVTVSLLASVTYTTMASAFSVPSSLYAPEEVPSTKPKPLLS